MLGTILGVSWTSWCSFMDHLGFAGPQVKSPLQIIKDRYQRSSHLRLLFKQMMHGHTDLIRDLATDVTYSFKNIILPFLKTDNLYYIGKAQLFGIFY